MKIEAAPIDSVSQDPANVRVHGPRNLEAIKASLRRFGQQKPIVVDARGVVLAGNGTLEAARLLGWEHIDVVRTSLAGSEAVAFAIADNRTSELAEWDGGKLAEIVRALRAEDEALAAGLMFDEEELEAMARAARGEPEELQDPGTIDPIANPVVADGDVWLAGKHRILCGDSTSASAWERVLAGARPVLCVTDPPYGGSIGRGGRVANDDRADWTEVWQNMPVAVVYCWHSGKHASTVQLSLEAAGFEIRAQIIWRKAHHPISRGNYHWRHEPCWYAVRKGGKAYWCGDRTQSTVWDLALDRDLETAHSTPKPVEAMGRPIRNHDAPEVCDPFLGSGTTLIAAEQLGRTGFFIEISPPYVEAALLRWEKLTGKQARREDGTTLEELHALAAA